MWFWTVVGAVVALVLVGAWVMDRRRPGRAPVRHADVRRAQDASRIQVDGDIEQMKTTFRPDGTFLGGP